MHVEPGRCESVANPWPQPQIPCLCKICALSKPAVVCHNISMVPGCCCCLSPNVTRTTVAAGMTISRKSTAPMLEPYFRQSLNPVPYGLPIPSSSIFTFIWKTFLPVSDAILHSLDGCPCVSYKDVPASFHGPLLWNGWPQIFHFPPLWLTWLVLLQALCTGYCYSVTHAQNMPPIHSFSHNLNFNPCNRTDTCSLWPPET